MKVVTWNINSLRVRLDRVLAFLDREAPDILCLQETKVEDAAFPLEAFQWQGYHLARHGQKTYNGVAIVSRQKPTDVVRGFDGDPLPEQTRVITATYGGVRVTNAYVVNGKSVADPAYDTKLRWLEALYHWARRDAAEHGLPHLIVGDFNVAPDDRDVHDPEAWQGRILCSERERDALNRFTDGGYADLHRQHTDAPGQYTWWDYRSDGFTRDAGLRIDLLLGDPAWQEALKEVRVDRDERRPDGAASKPSDHAPVIGGFDDVA